MVVSQQGSEMLVALLESSRSQILALLEGFMSVHMPVTLGSNILRLVF